MAGSKQCPKCSGSMVEGFVIDHTHNGTTVGSWVAGAPVKSVWTGLKLGGQPRIDIAAWRCSRCGFLEHYATGAPAAGAMAPRKVMLAAIVAAVTAALVAGVMVGILNG